MLLGRWRRTPNDPFFTIHLLIGFSQLPVQIGGSVRVQLYASTAA
jgi:hypothetical protein